MRVKRRLRWLLALAIAAGCGTSQRPAKSAALPGEPSIPELQTLRAPEAGRLYHGVLPQGTTEADSDVSPVSLDAYEHTVGRKVAYVYFSTDWFRSRAFPANTAGWVRRRGAVPFIRLMMRSQREPLITDPTFTLDRIVAGEFDAHLSAWADAARSFRTPLIVEYGTEVNGDWNPWSAPYNGGHDVGPEKFKRAYRHIVAVMRGRGAKNITWALHYNAENYPEDPRNVPAAYYPGDDVVDWVGISAYGSERSNDHRCPTFRSLVDDMLPQLRAATANKPLFIFEFGITNNNPRCEAGPWVQAALGDLLGGRWPDMRGFAWWHERWNNDGMDGSDMLVQDDEAVATAFYTALTGSGALKVVDEPVLQ
jgi:glycosyl hydrolase family 26